MSPGSGDAWEREPLYPETQSFCTVEQQKCLEKWQELKLRLHLHGQVHDWSRVENALLKIHESDLECALLLQATGSLNF